MPLLDPQHQFAPNWTFDALLITCIGGGTLLGPILGAVFYTLPKEYLALHSVDFHLLVFGALFMAIVLALPGGFVDLVDLEVREVGMIAQLAR